MPRKRRIKSRRALASDLKIAGVEMMPLPEYLAALNESSASAQKALTSGAFRPGDVKLPPSRFRTVLKTRAGRKVTPVASERGIRYRSIMTGRSVDLLGTGGAEGGFLDIRDVPPIAPAGVGASPADWVQGYLAGLPRYATLNVQEAKWSQATGRYTQRVRARRSATDEWRRRYFHAIRKAAAGRFPITKSNNAKSRGPRPQERAGRWDESEWHQSFYKELRENTNALMKAAKTNEGVIPANRFGSALDPSTATALFNAKPRTFDALADGLLETAQREFSEQMRAYLEAYVNGKAAALTRRGGPLHVLQGAFDVIQQLNEVAALELLAGLADKTIFPTGPDGTPNPVNLDLLKGRFAEKLSALGFDKAFEEVLGEDAAKMLKNTGVTGFLGKAASDLILNDGQIVGDLADKLMDQLPGAVVDQALDKLIGPVDDSSSLAKQVAAKYKGQIKSLLNQLMTSEGRQALQKKFDDTFKGAPSSACVKFGLANPLGGADVVTVNNLPTTRLNDDCDMPAVPDKGKFFQGNPTIFVNGLPPAGEIHAALGAQGTIATPMLVSPDVLMGSTTVTVAIDVSTQSPTASGGGSPASGSASASNSASGNKEHNPWSIGGILGKLWTLPNTVLGLGLGLLGHTFGWLMYGLNGLAGLFGFSLGDYWQRPGWDFKDNALEFYNNPLVLLNGGASAITLGNVISYGPYAPPTADRVHGPGNLRDHEKQHTYQGEQLGPLYLPSNIAGGVWALLNGESWHGPSNWNERGPQSYEPRPWRTYPEFVAESKRRYGYCVTNGFDAKYCKTHVEL